MTSRVSWGNDTCVRRRSWPTLTILLALATFAGWQLARSVQTVHAQPAARSLNLSAQRQFPSAYRGPVDALDTMARKPAALSLAAGDLDGDGYSDLAIGYATPSGGLIAIHHGNIDAFAPQSETAFWAIARGEFPSPFRPEADLVKTPVRPDFLAEGDLIGPKGSALAVAAKGGNSLAILSRDNSGAMQALQTINVPGSITALDVHDLARAKFHSLVVGVHTATGPQLLIYTGSHESLSESANFPLQADATSFASGDLDGDGIPDLVVIAGGTVSILHSSSHTLQPLATPFAVSRAALGRFLHDRSPVLQLALLDTDGSLHIMAREGFDSTPYTVREMNANKRARIAARLAAKQNRTPAAQSTAARTVVAWKEVESDSRVGVPDASGKTPLMFRTRVTNNGADDLMLLGASKLTLVSHPTSQPNEAQVDDRTELGADAVAAVAVRVNVDARPGVVYVAKNATAHSTVMPLADPSYTVNSTADALHSGACAAATAGECTLREAIVEANANSGVTQINIPNGTYTLTIARAACPTYTATTGTLDVVQSVNLIGSGESTTIIQAGTNSGTGASPNGVDKVFSFNQDITEGTQCSAFASFTNATVSVSNLTIQNGYNRGDYTTTFDGAGGAFDCDTGSSGNASVTLTNVTLNQNNAVPEDGGGFATFNDNGGTGSVTVTNATISNNKATGRDAFGDGGGAAAETGAFITMTGSTISGNSAVANGGGVGDVGSGDTFPESGSPEYIVNQVTLHAVTIANNTAGESGGGISSDEGGGALTIDQESVIANNSSVGGGGGINAFIYNGNSTTPCLGVAGCPVYNVSFMDITVKNNSVSGTQSAGDFGGGIYLSGGFTGTNFTMNYSRIVDNAAAVSSTGAGLAWYPGTATGSSSSQTINVAHNWWGTNTDPETAKLLAFDPNAVSLGHTTGIAITYTPFLVLSISANPTSVNVGSNTSTITASFLTNSGNGTESASNLGALVGVPVSFGGAVDGTLSGSQTTIQSSGTATSTFTGTHVGNGSAQATVDNQTVTTGTITVSSDTTTAATNATANFSESAQTVTLHATIIASTGDTVNAGTVTFTVLNSGDTPVGSPVTSGTVSGGNASANYSLPASTPAGTYTIQAVFNGGGGFIGSSDSTHALTVNAAGTTTTAANETANFSSSAQIVTLAATVTSPAGTVNAGTVTFTVLNGGTPIGTPTTSSTVSNGNASVNYTLPGGTASGTYTIQAVYNPSSNFTASSDTSHTLTISGGGSTVTAASNATSTYSPNSQSVTLNATVTSGGGTVNAGTITFTVFNGGTPIGTPTTSGAVSSGHASVNYTLPGGTLAGTYTIQAVFNAGGGFTGSSDTSHTLTIGKASPIITWSNPASIVFGSALSSEQLDAAANVPGAFVYTPPAGTVLPVGNNQTLSVQFTPTDTTDYNNAPQTAQINVTAGSSPATLVLTETLARASGTNDVVVTLTIANTGGSPATSVEVTVAKIGSTAALTALPLAVPNVPAGGSSTAVLTFPSSVGTSGSTAVLSLKGSYSGGSFGGSSRIVLP